MSEMEDINPGTDELGVDRFEVALDVGAINSLIIQDTAEFELDNKEDTFRGAIRVFAADKLEFAVLWTVLPSTVVVGLAAWEEAVFAAWICCNSILS